MKPGLRLLSLFLLSLLAACMLPVAATPYIYPTAAVTPLPTAGPSPTPTFPPTATPAANESILLGDRALLNGDWAAAAAHYNEALAAGVEPERAAFFLARALFDSGDLAGARGMLENLIGGAPAGELITWDPARVLPPVSLPSKEATSTAIFSCLCAKPAGMTAASAGKSSGRPATSQR